jgi:drug/metabolite transporter (DMT)-like permease
MRLVVGLSLALVSTLALNAGFLLQHSAAHDMPRIDVRRLRRSVVAFVHSPRWLVGFAAGIVGWGSYIAALALAALSLVQTVTASGVAVLALLAVAFAGAHLTRREWRGVALVVVGLGALGASLAGQPRPPSHGLSGLAVGVWVVAAAAACVVILSGGLSNRVRAASAGGLAAGILYGTGDLTTKALLVSVPKHAGAVGYLASPYLYLTVVAHASAFWILQRAFQQGTAVAAVSLMTAATNLLPIIGGVVVLGDPWPQSAVLTGVRLVAFVVVVVGSALLAQLTAEPASLSGLVGADDQA